MEQIWHNFNGIWISFEIGNSTGIMNSMQCNENVWNDFSQNLEWYGVD